MKKILSLMMCFAIVLNLCACSIISPKEVELVRLDASPLGDIFAVSHDSNENFTALLYTEFVFDEGENHEYENEDYISLEDEFIEPEEVELNYRLAVFDNRKNELLGNIEIEAEGDGGYFVDVSDDEIMLKNEQSSDMIIYDFELKNRSEGAYDFYEYWDYTQKIESVDSSRWMSMNGYTASSNFGEFQAFLFYDQPENFYMMKGNVYCNFRDLCGHKMLVEDTSGNQNDDARSILRIYDFDAKTEINSITVENNSDANNVQLTSFNESRVTISTCLEDGKFDGLYVWNYGLNAENTAFENGFCEVVAVDDIESQIQQACYRIKNAYEINVEWCADRDFIREKYSYTNDFKAVDYYLTVLDLEKYLSLLPKELYGEILGKNRENAVEQFDEFNMYIVGHFDEGAVDAFECTMFDEATQKNIVYIAFSYVGFSQKTFFHEIMHAMEHQIWAVAPDFDEEWRKLNPSDFEYTDDYVEAFYNEQNEAWQEYFARDYGMKNILEDRATCFEELCDAAFGDSCWWIEKPHIVAKQRYLTDILDEVYESLDMKAMLNNAISKGNTDTE